MGTQQLKVVNGIDLDLLEQYGTAMDSAGSGVCRARLTHRWIGAFAVEGRAERLEAGGDVAPRGHHEVPTDWPEPFSRDSGPTPGLELLLAAAAACAATTCAVKASTRGIVLESLEVGIDGAVDLRGLFERAPVQPGLTSIELELRVRSAADDAALSELAAVVRATSPVLNTLAASAKLQLSVRRLADAAAPDERDDARRHP